MLETPFCWQVFAMRFPIWHVIVVVCATAAAARAQAPTITASGDPSVASDTIYKLSVDSAAYPEQGTVLLLDDGIVTIEKDGRARQTYRQVVQILRDRAVKGYEERQFTYEPDREHFSVNWVRVLKPNGEIISAQPAHTQESDLPASMVNPVYVHERSVRMSLTGVAPGTLVDISWTTDAMTPYRPGDFHTDWSVSGGTTIRRSRFMVDVPKDVDLRITEHNLNFARQEIDAGNRKVYTWAAHDVPWIKSEMFAPPPDSDGISMSVSIATAASWSDIGHWYAALASNRMHADPKLRDTIKAVVGKATTLDDSIRAIHRWVAQDIRYVALELGIGGYQPRMPDTVVATGFGDCKDKASLFIAALTAIGVQAYPVLLSAGGRPDRGLPTIGAFNHEIAAIKRPSGYEFVDLTSELSPFGTLPYPDKDAFALIVHPDGRTEEVMTPQDPQDANRTEVHLTGALSPDGLFSGQIQIHGTGAVELAMRSIMRNRLDSAQRAAYIRTLAATVFPNAKGDSLVTFDGKDLGAAPTISLRITNGQATQHSGTTDILVMHDGSARWSGLADELEARAPRHRPIDASRVVGLLTESTETRITLPEGWQARLPPSVTANSAFGSYEAKYRQDGRDLVVTRLVSGTRGILSKDHAPELIAWFREVAKDRVPFIVIEHS
jgi:hypothetical protein